jgi:CcmD family protein
MNKIVKISSALILSPLTLLAQEVEMADNLRSSGKIYVVVAIVLVILLGLIGYLISLDRKVSRLEKRLPEAKK